MQTRISIARRVRIPLGPPWRKLWTPSACGSSMVSCIRVLVSFCVFSSQPITGTVMLRYPFFIGWLRLACSRGACATAPLPTHLPRQQASVLSFHPLAKELPLPLDALFHSCRPNLPIPLFTCPCFTDCGTISLFTRSFLLLGFYICPLGERGLGTDDLDLTSPVQPAPLCSQHVYSLLQKARLCGQITGADEPDPMSNIRRENSETSKSDSARTIL